MKTLYAMHDPMEKPRLATEEDLRENPIVKKLIQEAYDRGYSTATRINESYKDYGKYTEMGDL